MPRKPSETVQVNLRIKESLRRRLENAAHKRQVSLNYEMTSLLERGLDQPALLEGQSVAQDMAIMWARWGDAFTQINRQADLIVWVEWLIKQVENQADPESIKAAIARVRDVEHIIRLEASRLPERMNTAAPPVEADAPRGNLIEALQRARFDGGEASKGAARDTTPPAKRQQVLGGK
jgi:hypothetical protein